MRLFLIKNYLINSNNTMVFLLLQHILIIFYNKLTKSN